MPTIAYVDGFNLYYGLFKRQNAAVDPRYKWLDLRKFLTLHYPDLDITEINYYTARVSGTFADPDKSVRQQVYLDALKHSCAVNCVFGRFISIRRSGVPVGMPPGAPTVKIKLYEEKGSDVNLASHLIRDAFTERFNSALVVTNDTDLCEPVAIVNGLPTKQIWHLSPGETISASLAACATESRKVNKSFVASCQLPDVVHTSDGRTLRRPRRWS